MSEPTKTFRLPRVCYGPMCLKVLKEFMEYHNIPDMPIPQPKDSNDKALSKIFDIMICSMGEEKREAILKDAEEYLYSIPPSGR
jgi:hypothetical protein